MNAIYYKLTAILNCRSISNKTGVPIIADGGIKYSGDITKALKAAGIEVDVAVKVGVDVGGEIVDVGVGRLHEQVINIVMIEAARVRNPNFDISTCVLSL